jgi:protein-tyrosine phosphatase
MNASWDESAPGVVRLPSGRLVRGRGLRHPMPDGLQPTIGLYLLCREPASFMWDTRWLRWPDFWLPSDRSAAKVMLEQAWAEATTERVEIGCGGGRGRTGTALALLAVIDGVAPRDAVAFVRANYQAGAVETPWQRRYVERWLD